MLASDVGYSQAACVVADQLSVECHLSRYGVGMQQQRLQGATVLKDGRRDRLEAVAGHIDGLQTLQAAELRWQGLQRTAYLTC